MIKIYPSTISGHITAPASKAHAQRLMFMASMTAKPTKILNVPRCNDIDTTISCLEALGCTVEYDGFGGEVIIHPFPKTSPLQNIEFNFKDSSTTAHFMIALCSALAIKASCKASASLARRKMVQLTGRLALRGITFSSFSLPFEMSGRLSGGDFDFAGDEGSQAISAIMMFASCLLNDSTIRFTSPLADDSFVKLTVSAMNRFGVKVEETENGFNVIGRQYYQSPGKITVENDWGLAAMWALAGAACGNKGNGIVVDGLLVNSPQYYRDLTDILSLTRQDFRWVNFDLSKRQGIATLLCALAIVRGASIKLSGIPGLRHKECDRLAVMAEIAREFGQDAVVGDGEIEIVGNGNPVFPRRALDCHSDPWIFMSMVLASTKAGEEILLDDEHGADKIYINFLKDFESLGGKFEII